MAADIPVVNLVGALLDMPKTDCGLFILAIFLSPLAVVLKIGFKAHFWINLLIWLLCPIFLNIPHAWVVIALANVMKQKAKLMATVPELPQNDLLAVPPTENQEKLGSHSPSGSDIGSPEIIKRHTSPLPHTSLRNAFNSEGYDAPAPPVLLRRPTTGSNRNNRVFTDLDTVHERDETPRTNTVNKNANDVENPIDKVEPAKDSPPMRQIPQGQGQSPMIQPEAVHGRPTRTDEVAPNGEVKPATATATPREESQRSPARAGSPSNRQGTDAPPPTPSATSPKLADAQANEKDLQFDRQPDKLESESRLPRSQKD